LAADGNPPHGMGAAKIRRQTVIADAVRSDKVLEW
jgi:hypothetical protein